MQNSSTEASTGPHQTGSKSFADHSVSIGILTYKRPAGLQRCVASVRSTLDRPLPAPWTVHEILVIDNDAAESATPAVDKLQQEASQIRIPVRYVVESTPGIAAARARALAETTSHVLVFIDDDEVAEEGWPHGLLELMSESGAALVGGPVLSEFTEPPPPWISAGRFFDRDDPPHGSEQDWLRSGNLAIDLHQVKSAGVTFDQRFPQGEDSAFSRQARARGLDLRWSSNGAITEFVEPGRFDMSWRLRREFLGHRAWTRSSLDLAGSPINRLTARLRIVATAGVRVGTGLIHLGKSVPIRSKAEAVLGLIDFVGVAGKLIEVVSYRRPDVEQR